MRKFVHVLAISLFLFSLSAQAQSPSFTASGVLNAASLVSGPLAPGMVTAITGSNLGDPNFPGNCIQTKPTPNTCLAVNVLVNGAVAPKIFDSATEVTFQVPFSVTGSSATVQVTSSLSGSTLSSATVTVPVAPTAPGMFAGVYDPVAPLGSQTAQMGDTVIVYGTGFGATTPAVATGAMAPAGTGAQANANVTLTVNNQPVPVIFAGLEPSNATNATPGYDEVEFVVPSNLSIPASQPTGTFPVVVTVGGVAAPAVNLVVASPGLSITAIYPSPVSESTNPQTLTFTGTGFTSGLTMEVESPGKVVTPIPASSIDVLSSTQFTAQITTGTATGTWSAVAFDVNGNESSVFTFTVAPPGISYIITTSSGNTSISENEWIEIHGTSLSNSTTTWSNSNFSSGLPATLAGVTVTVDGAPVALFYVSPTQINALSPLDTTTGKVNVVVDATYGTVTSSVNEVQVTPTLLVIDGASHVAAQDIPSYALLGPASLSQPGYPYRPATAGETIIVYATGFGQTSPLFANQLGNTGFPGADPFPLNLPNLPTMTIGNLPATVTFAGLVSPGLYQLNVTIPTSAPAGDLPIVVMYNGSSTQNGAVITVN